MPNPSILPYGPQSEIFERELRDAGLTVRCLTESGPFVKLLVAGSHHSTTIIIERAKHGYAMYNFAETVKRSDDVAALLKLCNEPRS